MTKEEYRKMKETVGGSFVLIALLDGEFCVLGDDVRYARKVTTIGVVDQEGQRLTIQTRDVPDFIRELRDGNHNVVLCASTGHYSVWRDNLGESKIIPSTWLEEFVNGYLTCALWSSTDEKDQPLDKNRTIKAIAPDSVNSMRQDCFGFVADQWADLQTAQNDFGRDPERLGHDFWLTRNHHGAGFWDEGMGKLGDRLTEASHPWGSCDLYVGDDKRVHVS